MKLSKGQKEVRELKADLAACQKEMQGYMDRMIYHKNQNEKLENHIKILEHQLDSIRAVIGMKFKL